MRLNNRASSAHIFLLSALLAGCGVGTISGELALDELEEQPFQFLDEVRQGETVFDGAASVIVPAPGIGVAATVLHDDGHAEILRVETLSDGRVVRYLDSYEFHEVAAEKQAQLGEKAAFPECNQGAYSLLGYKWTKKMKWRANLGTRPSYLSATAVRKALRRAVGNITASRNRCDLADRVSASAEYLGSTTRHAQVTSAAACGSNDGVNVMSFGSLPGGILAVTCTYFDSSRRAMNSDIKFNRTVSWYPRGTPTQCSQRYSLRAVGTHEVGHAYGLGHVSESMFPWMTMSTNVGPCSNSHASLGLGDVRGLRKLY